MAHPRRRRRRRPARARTRTRSRCRARSSSASSARPTSRPRRWPRRAAATSATGRACTRKKTVNPPAGAGIQIDGYFPDDSTTNTTNGWNHDSQFVIRLPENWNGQLVITGAPGVRKQYAPDYILSDWLLSQGYAYASTDKGNTGTSFYENGVALGARPGRAGVARPGLRARRRRQAGGRPALRGRPGAHLDDRHLQRRLPHPVAAGEPARPVRRRGRLGGHPDDRRRAEPLHLPADGAARVPAGRGRPRGTPADVRRRLRARLGGPVGRPLRRLLGPHPAQLPGGVRPRLRRRDQGGHAVLPDRRRPGDADRVRRRVRLRVPAAGGEGRRRARCR